MTVLLRDADALLESRGGRSVSSTNLVRELVYADDTLIIDAEEQDIQKVMECVAECGQHYGLVFNWSKLEAMCVRTAADIKTPDGKSIRSAASNNGVTAAAHGTAQHHRNSI